jgi:hypothetical protein
MIQRLSALISRTYDYCVTCGWWVKDCGHTQ